MLDLHCLVKNLSIVKMQEAGGTKHTGVPVKTLKKLLKKAGLKVSGKKATLTRRAKKARLLGGGIGRAPHSSVSGTFGDKGILPQYPQAVFDAKKAREIKNINDTQAVAEATEIQDAATQKRTDEIKRATPSYGYMFGGRKKKVKSNY
jgi:hypothetical protein